jgi:DNA-binding HxlR family transcriptional regulator
MPVSKRKSASSLVAKRTTSRRSRCPVACALDVFGDRWTLLVIRDLILGKRRFKDFVGSPEGIPTNILADRLKRLQSHQVVTQISDRDGSRHLSYQLTEKGRALLPVVKAMKDWGLAWEKGTKAALLELGSGA